MILAIDIGNTTTGMGLFHNGAFIDFFRIKTDRLDTLSEVWDKGDYPNGSELEAALIASVNPLGTEQIMAWSEEYLRIAPKIVQNQFPVRIPILLKKRQEVGADRLLNAVAALRRFPGPLIVVDFGTAVTFDVITRAGEYAGGAIAPGIRLSAESLAEKAALLPLVRPRIEPPLIGRSTRGAIASGLYYGFLAMVRGMLTQFKDQLGSDVKVLATGGDAHLIAENMELIDAVIPELTLEGLVHTYLTAMETQRGNEKKMSFLRKQESK